MENAPTEFDGAPQELFDEFAMKAEATEDSLQGFIDYMNRFEQVKSEWIEWLTMAQEELHQCKQKCDTIEMMSSKLERIQVSQRLFISVFLNTRPKYVTKTFIYFSLCRISVHVFLV